MPDPIPVPPTEVKIISFPATTKTLRDDYAMAALTGLLANVNLSPVYSVDRVVEDAFRVADKAMVARDA